MSKVFRVLDRRISQKANATEIAASLFPDLITMDGWKTANEVRAESDEDDGDTPFVDLKGEMILYEY